VTGDIGRLAKKYFQDSQPCKFLLKVTLRYIEDIVYRISIVVERILY
jgi:hypothetical protein